MKKWVIKNMGKDSAIFTIARPGNAVRPTNEVMQEKIHGPRKALGFRWVDIARMLGMSTRTLSRRCQELCMLLGHQHNFSTLSD